MWSLRLCYSPEAVEDLRNLAFSFEARNIFAWCMVRSTTFPTIYFGKDNLVPLNIEGSEIAAYFGNEFLALRQSGVFFSVSLLVKSKSASMA
jgi:hypothetical protein